MEWYWWALIIAGVVIAILILGEVFGWWDRGDGGSGWGGGGGGRLERFP